MSGPEFILTRQVVDRPVGRSMSNSLQGSL